MLGVKEHSQRVVLTVVVQMLPIQVLVVAVHLMFASMEQR
jgi:hypothetical protein